MFPRKQYTYRSGDPSEQTTQPGGVTLIDTYKTNMPLGTFAYPYKTESKFEDPNYEDVFAILTSKGWRFFQAEKENGNIFKMWKNGLVKLYVDDFLYNNRVAEHIDENSECGPHFLSGMNLGQGGEEYKHQYICCNTLPFKDAFYNYKGISKENDVRKYILCTSDDIGGSSSAISGLPWKYKLTLVPQDENIVVAKSYAPLNVMTKGTSYYNSRFSREDATRDAENIFEGYNSTLHVSWGEYAEPKKDYEDREVFRYFELDGGDGPNGERMALGSTTDKIAVYGKNENVDYSQIAELLTHTTEDGNDVDTVLKFNNRYLFRTIYNDKVENLLKLQLGDMIRQDDVILFMFDSCVDDPERKEIREALLAKYKRSLQRNGGRPSDMLLCYKPDLDLASDDDTFRSELLSLCKIKRQ